MTPWAWTLMMSGAVVFILGWLGMVGAYIGERRMVIIAHAGAGLSVLGWCLVIAGCLAWLAGW